MRLSKASGAVFSALAWLALAAPAAPAAAFAPPTGIGTDVGISPAAGPARLPGRRTLLNDPHPSPSSPSSTSASTSTALFGIPKMFRWLTDQYPTINKRLNEGLTSDTAVDCFYLDMNGIIHPCTHGNNDSEIIVLDEAEMFKKIFSYVDR